MLKWFQKDPETLGVALIGEIGGNAEELAAEFIVSSKFNKPVAAYIAGRTAIPGKRMGHAGAIISGGTGTAESKINALRNAGVSVGERPIEIAELLDRLLN
jgi:succinyl-CoA synthetase alpha subunit